MSKVEYKKSSPYSTTKQSSWFLGNLQFRNIPTDSSDKQLVIQSKYNQRPDLLSFDLYGTPDYWWTFMILNPNALKDPIFDFVTGLTLYTALPDRLSRVLGN